MSNFFSLPISVTTQQVPKDYVAPDDMQGLLEAIPRFTDMEMTDTGANVTMNADGAGADLNGLWVWRLDRYKLPPRLMTGYHNNWWQLYSGIATEISMFAGYPAGYFDSSGRGIRYAGWEGWQLCNGQNGSINLENFFVIPGYRNDGVSWVASVYWKPAVTVNPDGTINWGTATQDFIDINPKERQFTISLSNFPLFAFWVNWSSNFKFTKSGSGDNWNVRDPGPPQGSNFNIGNWKYEFDQHASLLSYPISRIPPYVAVAFVQFIGYQ